MRRLVNINNAENHLDADEEATPEELRSVGCFFISIIMVPITVLILVLFLIIT